MLHCVAACCSVLQRVAACCSVLQCVAVCCNVLQCVAVSCSKSKCLAVYTMLVWHGIRLDGDLQCLWGYLCHGRFER